MSPSNPSAKTLAQLAERAGTDPQMVKPHPSDLKDHSIKLFPKIKGSPTYVRRLEEMAKDLYRQITAAPSVLTYVESGKSVLGNDNTRGVIKPFEPKHERDNRQALKWLLHSMAFVASAPTKSEKTKDGGTGST